MEYFKMFIKLREYEGKVQYNDIIIAFNKFITMNKLNADIGILHRTGELETYLKTVALEKNQCCGNKPYYIFTKKNILKDIIGGE